MRILADSCLLAKKPIPDWHNQELQKLILSKCNIIIDGENSFNPILITKSELYKNNETTHERLMRDYVTAKLY